MQNEYRTRRFSTIVIQDRWFSLIFARHVQRYIRTRIDTRSTNFVNICLIAPTLVLVCLVSTCSCYVFHRDAIKYSLDFSNRRYQSRINPWTLRERFERASGLDGKISIRKMSPARTQSIVDDAISQNTFPPLCYRFQFSRVSRFYLYTVYFRSDLINSHAIVRFARVNDIIVNPR